MEGGIDFPSFVRANTPALFRSAYLLTRDRSSAEDLVQETFTRLYPQWSRVANAQVPLAYVRRSIVNTFLNTRRGSAGHEVLFADPPDRPGAPDLAVGVTDRDLVRALLDTLSAKQRAVIVLRFFHDLTDAEIAADLGCRQGTVRSIVSRALAMLREDLRARAEAESVFPANGATA
jgi:RNA polymerase sigma-70 factor (sigma-E family)